MIYHLRVILLLFALISAGNAFGHHSDRSSGGLASLEYKLDNFDRLKARRTLSLDSIRLKRETAGPTTERILLAETLGYRYISYDVDTALMYWRLGLNDANQFGNKELAMRLRMQLLASLPRLGVVKEAIDSFDEIDAETLPRELREYYWRAASELYYCIAKPYPKGELRDKYYRKTIEALDSLSSYYPSESTISRYIAAMTHNLRGENNLAVANLVEILPRLEGRAELYDHALEIICNYYRERPAYRTLYMDYLLERVNKRLDRGLVKPGLIAELGKELCADGEMDLGRRCLRMAMSASEEPSGPYRAFDRTEYFNFLADENSTKTRILYWIIGVLTVLLAGAVGAGVVMMRRWKSCRLKKAEQVRRLEEMAEDMRKTCQGILSLAFLSVEQLKEYNVFVTRKLKAGQAKDLYAEVDSGKYLQSQTEKFFETFDESFLESFPDFVHRLNALLLPDRQMAMMPGGRFSPELRIAAFMRLGVTDSSKLSQVLGLSLNTIYTYRNRLKGRAIDRDNFEGNIQKIGTTL